MAFINIQSKLRCVFAISEIHEHQRVLTAQKAHQELLKPSVHVHEPMLERLLKTLIKSFLAKTPYRILRTTNVNRFQAIDVSLRSLYAAGYRPQILIDGGAHLGQFALEACTIFPGVEVHLIEPQPACQEELKKLSAKKGFVLHPFLIASDDEVRKGNMRLEIADFPTTGAHVAINSGPASKTVLVPSSTLDQLFADKIKKRHRTLLKLDLQGYELAALNGGKSLLNAVEVILTEVSFYAQAYEPPISKLISFLDQNEFELFDIASLYARPRDNRARQGDFIFVRRNSPLSADTLWS